MDKCTFIFSPQENSRAFMSIVNADAEPARTAERARDSLTMVALIISAVL